jgi:cytoskeletal protein CcmA (bactofilin family)
MFGKNKDSQLGKHQTATLPYAAKVAGQQIQQSTVAQPGATTAQPEATSCISSGMTVVGKLVGDGSVMVFGHVEGELQASNVVIREGAQVEGNVVAKELTIAGFVKGTVHAVRVKLLSTAVVEGDIFHRSLAIEEDARFEGTSRREDNLVETPSSVQGKILDSQSKAQPQIGLVDGNGKSKGKPDNKDLHSAN